MSTETEGTDVQEQPPAEVLARVDDAVFALDRNWQVTFVDESAAALLDGERADLLGASLWETVPETAETCAYDEFHAAVESGESTRFTLRYDPVDAWYAVRAYPGGGGLTVYLEDVTEDRRRQNETRRERRLFEAAFEAGTDALVVVDADSHIVEFNHAAAGLFGYDADEVVGRDVAALYAEGTDREFEDVAGERRSTTRVRYARSDGTTFEGETGWAALDGPDGEPLAVLWTIRDVRAREEGDRETEAPTDALRSFHDVTTDTTRSFEERIAAVLELGTDHLGLDVGILAEVDGTDYTVTTVVAPDDGVPQGATFPLAETFCDLVVARDTVVSFDSAVAGGVQTHPAYHEQGLEAYLGAPVVVDGERFGTLNFSSPAPRDEPFTESEETFVRLLAQWVGKELGSRRDRNSARANRDRLRQIIDMLPQLVFAKDDAGEFLLVNQAVADAYGTTVDALEGSTDADFADSAAEAAQFREDDRAVIASGEPKHIDEEPLTTADGEKRLLETTKIPYEPVDIDGPAVLGVATDITELKAREAELERQSAALEASMDGIAILDTDGTFVYMNRAHAGVFDHDPAELVGSSWRRLYGRDEIDRIETEVFPVLERDGEWRGETVGERRNGDPVPQDVTLSALPDGGLICTNRDVTERKRREEQLRTVRQRFDRFARAVPNALFLISPDYTETYFVNPASEALYGVPEAELQADPKTWMRHLHPDDRERLRGDVAEQMDRDADWPTTQEFRIQHPERGLRWIHARLNPIREDDGEIVELAGVSTDITERKRLEQSLRESERSLQRVAEVASDTEQDFERKLETILELGCKRLGLPYGFLNRIDEDRQYVVGARGSHPLLQAGESTPLSTSYCRRTVERDGVVDVGDAVEEGWRGDPAYETFDLGCYIGGKITVDGDVFGTLCFADHEGRTGGFDETERAFVDLLTSGITYELAGDAVETKLRQLNETAQRLMATAVPTEIASIATESAKSVLDLSMTGIWWYDASADALVPAGMTEEAAAVVDDQPTFDGDDALAWDAFEQGEVLVFDELLTAEGRHNEDTPLRSEVIVPLGDHGVLISGATRRRAFSETDRSLLEVLSATVEAALNRADREQVLRETRERLEQSNEELEQFAYAASHDLQEPLRTVSSYLTLLERRHREDLSADALDFVDLAVDGADRMRNMIQALLEFSRVDTRGGAFEPTEMNTVFEQVRRNLELTIEEAGATVDVPDSAGRLAGDENQLVQLFQNLVENGIKYSERTPHVEVSIERHGDEVTYAVTDDGIGMEPDQFDGIFEVFHRLHTREEFDGTGIGLSICRKIVDRHGGRIRVESAPGSGSTFFVTLPVEGPERE